jgi:hypothetical protein
MRRILLVLSVMALLMMALAAPAFAKNTFPTEPYNPPGPPNQSYSGEDIIPRTVVFHCNASGDSGNFVTNKNHVTGSCND